MMTTQILDGVKYLKLSIFRKLDRILNLTVDIIFKGFHEKKFVIFTSFYIVKG